MRKEFGYERVKCDCNDCIEPCTYLPGYLIPADLERMKSIMDGMDIFKWAEEHLLASPGATVFDRNTGEVCCIPTLVPSRGEDGFVCHWLKDNKCTVHEISPFGCAFFKVCEERDNWQELSLRGLQVILEDHQNNGTYSQVWYHLNQKGLIAKSSTELKLLHFIRKGKF